MCGVVIDAKAAAAGGDPKRSVATNTGNPKKITEQVLLPSKPIIQLSSTITSKILFPSETAESYRISDFVLSQVMGSFTESNDSIALPMQNPYIGKFFFI